MVDINIDVSEFVRLADDLETLPDRLLDSLKPVVAKGALKVKTSMKADMAASQHFGQVSRSITYDTTSSRDAVEAQIGPVTQGNTVGDLAHFAYFGAPNGGGNTVRDPQRNLDDEADSFEAACGAVIQGLL